MIEPNFNVSGKVALVTGASSGIGAHFASVLAEEGADVIFGVGRRLPRWPECHVPGWAIDMSWEDQKSEIKESPEPESKEL